MELTNKDMIEKTIYDAYVLSNYSTALQCLLSSGEGGQQLDIKQSEVLSLFIFIDETSKNIQKNLNTILDSLMDNRD